MTGSSKKKSKIKITIIITASVIFFIFFGTLFIDMLLIKTEHAPVFSNIAKTAINEGEVVVGRGILYKTIVHRIDASNGYLAGYVIFFPWDDGYAGLEDDPPVVSMKFHGTLDESGAAAPEKESSVISGGEDIEFDEMDTLNMDLIKRLADGEIDPFEFMEKFTGTVFDENESNIYYLRLMNNYSLQIEYSGDKIIEMRLIDELYDNQYINIETQLIDLFLTLREEN